MVAGFRRSFSLTISTNSSSPVHPSSPKAWGSIKPYHVRSTSVPCRSHPIISQVEDDIRGLRVWQSLPHPDSPSTSSSSWLCDGLAQFELLLASLDHLIQLPQSMDSLSRPSSASWADNLLDNILRLADAHCSFRSAAMDLKQHHADAQIAIRRSDQASLASSLRSQRKAEKELLKLASSFRNVARPSLHAQSNDEEAELAGILGEAITVTMAASQALFSGVAAASSAVAKSSPSPPSSPRLVVSSLRRLSSSSRKKEDNDEEALRARALESSRAMEDCLAATERRSERVMKSLINTRVALLNTFTPSF